MRATRDLVQRSRRMDLIWDALDNILILSLHRFCSHMLHQSSTAEGTHAASVLKLTIYENAICAHCEDAGPAFLPPLSLRSLLLIQEQVILGYVNPRSAHGRHPSPRSLPWSGPFSWSYAGPQPRALPRILTQHDGPQSWSSFLWSLPAGSLWIRPRQCAPSAQSKGIKAPKSFHLCW